MSTMQQTGTQSGTQARDQLREQIRQTIQDANAAARDARDAGRSRVVISGIPQPPTPPDVPRTITIQGGGFGPAQQIPRGVENIANGFFVMCAVIVIGWPLARAFGKRIERRAAEPSAANPQMADQLQRIEQAVDAMSIEIERISESQRFMAKLQNANAERAALPAERT